MATKTSPSRLRYGRYLGMGVAAAMVCAAAGWVLLQPSSEPTRLRILFTGETMGELEPCKCSGPMAGGLPLRGGYILTQTLPYLLVDLGCVGRGAREFEQLRAHATLRAMKRMNYHAVNVAEHELWLGRRNLRELSDAGVAFISANVIDTTTGEAMFPTMLRVRVGESRVAVTGLVAHDVYQVGPGLAVQEPIEALGRLLPQLVTDSDAIVVLADLTQAQARELADRFPELSVILFRGRGESKAPEKVNQTILASIYGEARYIGDLQLLLQHARVLQAQGVAVLLDESINPDPAVTEIAIDWYKQKIRGMTFDLAQPQPGWPRLRVSQPEPGNAYVGDQTCAACHATLHEQWSTGPHANAMQSLQRAGYDFSPECVVCHVTGYGARGGYINMSRTPAMGRVGCETCHGPGMAHAKDPQVGLIDPGGAQSCQPCHTAKHDPKFTFEPDWNRAGHGPDTQRSEGDS